MSPVFELSLGALRFAPGLVAVLASVAVTAVTLHTAWRAWQRLARELPESAYAEIGKVIGLEEVPQAAADIIAGRIRGRTLVDPNL